MMKLNFATIIVLLSAMVIVSCKKKRPKFLGSYSDSSYSDYSDLFSSYDYDSDSYHRHHDSSDDYRDSYYDSSGDKKHNKKKHSPSISHGSMLQMFLPIAAEKTNYRRIVGSQLSAIFPLGKLVFGASGETKSELLSALGLRSENEVGIYFKKLLSDLESLQGVYLEIASRLYLSDQHKINRHYKAKVDAVFRSSCEIVDMRNPSIVAANINWWVDEKTHGRIKELISPKAIEPGASLIVVNAIYFSGKWKVPFKYEVTEAFHGEETRMIPMMRVSSRYNYGFSNKLNAAMIEIPYQGAEASMVIILPKKGVDLKSVLSQMKQSSGDIEKLVHFEKTLAEITIPKFKIETELDLGLIYRQIGVRQMFSARSKLTGIAEKSRDKVRVSHAVQKAVIEVNEIGTKAAAASAVQSMVISNIEDKIYFKANRPFVFLIMAKKYQLFSGVFS